jgi:hypothetical protein
MENILPQVWDICTSDEVLAVDNTFTSEKILYGT